MIVSRRREFIFGVTFGALIIFGFFWFSKNINLQNAPLNSEGEWPLFVPIDQAFADIEVNGHSLKFHSNATKSALSSNIRIHLVFHSHVDPGWLKTFEEYYQEEVKSIISSAVEALNKFPKLKFIWSETSFLERWWRNATEKQKSDIQRQVKSGRLEISGGAWVMTDEATPTFYGAIENLIESHSVIHEIFGLTPNTSWSVDPFGDGAMMPELLELGGVERTMFPRGLETPRRSSARYSESPLLNCVTQKIFAMLLSVGLIGRFPCSSVMKGALFLLLFTYFSMVHGEPCEINWKVYRDGFVKGPYDSFQDKGFAGGAYYGDDNGNVQYGCLSEEKKCCFNPKTVCNPRPRDFFSIVVHEQEGRFCNFIDGDCQENHYCFRGFCCPILASIAKCPRGGSVQPSEEPPNTTRNYTTKGTLRKSRQCKVDNDCEQGFYCAQVFEESIIKHYVPDYKTEQGSRCCQFDCTDIPDNSDASFVERMCERHNGPLKSKGYIDFSRGGNDPLKKLCDLEGITSIDIGIKIETPENEISHINFCESMKHSPIPLILIGTSVNSIELDGVKLARDSNIHKNPLLDEPTLEKISRMGVKDVQTHSEVDCSNIPPGIPSPRVEELCKSYEGVLKSRGYIDFSMKGNNPLRDICGLKGITEYQISVNIQDPTEQIYKLKFCEKMKNPVSLILTETLVKEIDWAGVKLKNDSIINKNPFISEYTLKEIREMGVANVQEYRDIDCSSLPKEIPASIVEELCLSDYSSIRSKGYVDFSESGDDPFEKMCNTSEIRSVEIDVRIYMPKSDMKTINFCEKMKSPSLILYGSHVKELNIETTFRSVFVHANKYLTESGVSLIKSSPIEQGKTDIQLGKECIMLEEPNELDGCEYIYGDLILNSSYIQSESHQIKGFSGCLDLDNPSLNESFFDFLNPNVTMGQDCNGTHRITGTCLSKILVERLSSMVNSNISFNSTCVRNCTARQLVKEKFDNCETVIGNIHLNMRYTDRDVANFQAVRHVIGTINLVFILPEGGTIHHKAGRLNLFDNLETIESPPGSGYSIKIWNCRLITSVSFPKLKKVKYSQKDFMIMRGNGFKLSDEEELKLEAQLSGEEYDPEDLVTGGYVTELVEVEDWDVEDEAKNGSGVNRLWPTVFILSLVSSKRQMVLWIVLCTLLVFGYENIFNSKDDSHLKLHNRKHSNPSYMEVSLPVKYEWRRRRSSNTVIPLWRPIQAEAKYDHKTITNNPEFDGRDRMDINKPTIRAVKFHKDALEARNLSAKTPNLNPKMTNSNRGVVETATRSLLHATGATKKDVNLIATSKATIQARRCFKCPTLEGVELEGQGDNGSAFAHLEKRVTEVNGDSLKFTSNETKSAADSQVFAVFLEKDGFRFFPELNSESSGKCILNSYNIWNFEISESGKVFKSNFTIITDLEFGLLKIKDKKYHCQGRCVFQQDNWSNNYSDWQKDSNFKYECDFVEARCAKKRKSFMGGEFLKEFSYGMIHTQVFEKGDAKSHIYQKPDHVYDVFVILIDSTGMSQAYRNLPKTMSYLEKSMQSVTFPQAIQLEAIVRTVYGLSNIGKHGDWDDSCRSFQFDDSFLVLQGDHGLRFGDVVKTKLGFRDNINPLFTVPLPKNLRNSPLRDQMVKNSKYLQTHYDVRATYLDIARYQPKSGFTDLENMKIPKEKGQSLFRRQIGERPCQTSTYLPEEEKTFSLVATTSYPYDKAQFTDTVLSPAVKFYESKRDLGALEFADYCPYYTVNTKQQRETKSNLPTTHTFDYSDDKARRSRKGQLYTYSKTSRCFNLVKEPEIEDEGKQTISTTSGTLHGCYEPKCENGSLWIKTAKSKFYQCFHTDQLIHVNKRLTDEKATTEFQIKCPSCSDYCPERDDFSCKDRRKYVPTRVGDPEKKQRWIFGDSSSEFSYPTSAASSLILFFLMYP